MSVTKNSTVTIRIDQAATRSIVPSGYFRAWWMPRRLAELILRWAMS